MLHTCRSAILNVCHSLHCSSTYIYCYFRVGGGDGKVVKAAWVPLVNGEEFLLLVDIRKTIFEVIPPDLDCKNYKHVPVF